MALAGGAVADPETFLRREAEYSDLALMEVAVDVIGGLTGLGERVDAGQGRVDQALGDQPVGLPRLAVVREVRPDYLLQVHPQVAVVVGVHEATRGRAGRDRPAASGDVHGRAEGLPPGVLEDDVGILTAGELADLLAEALPLLGVLGVLVGPEPVVLGGPVDHQVGAHPAHDLGFAWRGHDTHRDGATVQCQLGRVGAEPAARAPDEYHVALFHVGAVVGYQLAVGGGVHQPGGGGLLPAQVRGFGHELVGLDQGQLGESAEVRLKAPDALLGVEHGVVVAVRAFQLDRQAVGDHLITGGPHVYAGTGTQDDTGEVRADHMVGEVVAFAERGQPAVALQEAERRQWFEDRRPDGVVVDRGGHHGDQRLARTQIRGPDLVDVQGAPGVLVPGREPVEDIDLVLADHRSPVGLGYRQGRERRLGCVRGENCLDNFLHDRPPVRHPVALGRCY